MEYATSPGGEPAFPPELLAIWADPGVRNLAVRRAGDPDLAQDALLQAVCAVARVPDLPRIKDLKAYFCRVLINEVYRLRGQLAAARPCDPVNLAEMGQRGAGLSGLPAPKPLAEAAVTRLMAQLWLARFRANRDRLRAGAPGRSSQPDRYRDLIVAVAEHVLRAALDGDVSQPDTNGALRAAFPEWFGRPGDDDNTHHKHLSRAHLDIQALLRAVVTRDELLP